MSVENKVEVIDEELVEKLERIAYILKTVAHPLRLGIVHLLELHPQLSVSQICESLGSEQSLTSRRTTDALLSKRKRRIFDY